MKYLARITSIAGALSGLAAWVGLAALPVAAQKVYAIQGGRVHTLAGPPIEGGTVIIRDGKIAAVGTGVVIPVGAQVINARGLEVYPGLFDSVSQMGLIEMDSIPATVDTVELGDFNPQLLAASAIHPASEHIPVARASGVTHALAAPGQGSFFLGGGSLVGGQASVIHLVGWVMDEMLIRRSAAMVINWPTIGGGTFDFTTFSFRRRPFAEAKQEYERRVAELADRIERARHYAQAVEKGSREKFERDLKLEALVPVVKGELPVLVIANDARDIRNTIEFCEKHKLKLVIAGGLEAWKVKDLLKQKSIPVILRPTQTLPLDEDDPYDKPFTAPGELHAAGVKIAFATFGGGNSAVNSYALAYQAGNAVAYALPHEEAVKAVTLYPAQMLGLADRLGSIEPGKIANLIVTNGDPLELTTQVRYLFINGQLTSTDNRHRQLYETYRARP